MHKKFIILIILLGLVAYGNTVFNSLICDDEFVIVRNAFIKSLDNFPRLFDRSYLTKASDVFFVSSLRERDIGSAELSYRPVTTLSHMFEYAIWRLDPLGYHLDNILLHILCAVLLYIFIFLTLNDAAIAFWSGLVFAIHPLHAEVINIVSFREDILVGIFALCSFIAYIFYKRHSHFKRFVFYFLSLLSFALAIFSKEMAITLPALIILYDLYFEYKGKLKPILINIKSRYLGFVFIAVIYLYINFVIFANTEGGAAKGRIGGSFYIDMLTMAVIISDYITSFWFPLNMKIIPVHYAPITKILFSREAILAIGLIAMFIILALEIRKKSKVTSFFIFWFFIALLPVSNIIPLVNPMAYRYIYFPVMGFCVLLAIILKQLKNFKTLAKISPNFYRILQASIIAFFIALSIPHNLFYKDKFSHAKETLRNFPNDFQSLGDMGFAALEKGDYYKALIYFKHIVRNGRYDPLTWLNLGICYDHLERYDEAVEEYKKALMQKPDYTAAYYNIGIAYLKKGDFKSAIEYFQKTKAIDSGFVNTYRFIAEAYLKLKKPKFAIAELKKGLEIFPGDKDLQELLLKTETKKK